MKKGSQELVYRIALTLIPGVGPVLARNLVSYCGSVEGVFSEKMQHLLKIPEIGPVTAASITRHRFFERAEQEMRFIEQHNVRALFYLDEHFPKRLGNCMDAPVMLYYTGNHDLNSSRMLAVVGTRKATDYGRKITEELITGLVARNITVISGLAYGIDICAHKTAVKLQVPTIGVLGHGLDRLYPDSHRSTAAKMLQNGGLLTEYPSETKPDKENFPQRNRIIAGICDAVLVIEAARKGGALITAHIADSYNRDVFAVPGRLNDPWSEGCNHLIKTNKAVLIESAADIEYMMGWEDQPEKTRKQTQRQLFIEFSEDEKVLVDMLEKNGSMHIDALCLDSALPMSKVSMNLLNLEFNGVLKSLPGKIYELA